MNWQILDRMSRIVGLTIIILCVTLWVLYVMEEARALLATIAVEKRRRAFYIVRTGNAFDRDRDTRKPERADEPGAD
jgi:hypothetical protein